MPPFTLQDIVLTVSSHNGGNWDEFHTLTGDRWDSLLERSRLQGEEEDYLWIIGQGEVFYFLFLYSRIHCHIARSRTIDLYQVLDTSYLLMRSYEGDDFFRSVRESYYLLSDPEGFGLDPGFPLFRKPAGSTSGRKLVISYGQAGPYVLQIPFDHFAKYGLGYFSSYTWMEYIGSDKDFVTHLKEWREILETGKNSVLFIRHAYILINIYPDFNIEGPEMATVREALTLLEKVASALGDIQTRRYGYISLQLRINPGKEAILEALRRQETLFVFACFHTVDGQWTLPEERGDFHEEVMRSDLSHIRLMRIYHCHSLVGSVSRSDIVRQLLHKGVKRVEGSIFQQDIKEYLEYLLTLFSATGLGLLFRSDRELTGAVAGTLLQLRQQLNII